jgi:hypothetical protein
MIATVPRFGPNLSTASYIARTHPRDVKSWQNGTMGLR